MNRFRRWLSDLLRSMAELVDPDVDDLNELVIETLLRHPEKLADNIVRNNVVLQKLKAASK